MASAGEDIIAACCTCCGLALCASVANWFTTQPFGSGRGSTTGCSRCCGPCCSKSFDEDAFEEQVRKDMEKTRGPNVPPVQQQMTPSPAMKANSES